MADDVTEAALDEPMLLTQAAPQGSSSQLSNMTKEKHSKEEKQENHGFNLNH